MTLKGILALVLGVGVGLLLIALEIILYTKRICNVYQCLVIEFFALMGISLGSILVYFDIIGV